MRLRNIPGAGEVIEKSEYVIKTPHEMKGHWNEIFRNSNPIYIEIGMGKGRFITENALNNPGINYIGIERYTSVLLRAVQKMDELEKETRPSNLRFLCMDAAEITDVFEKEEVSKIFLNFSDPWPKERHAKRRLPSKEFLKRYDGILKNNGDLEFKTDNKDLFDFALSELEPAGWKLKAVTRDLHNDPEMSEGNIMTEYEEKFSAMGNPIYKYVIYR